MENVSSKIGNRSRDAAPTKFFEMQKILQERHLGAIYELIRVFLDSPLRGSLAVKTEFTGKTVAQASSLFQTFDRRTIPV